ncbi:DUF11 domain-containing protein [Almyronema epifaneia]|uniref:DUF11 domain-containing protein n=1 Tax=Almyronema epifaneia S1 TaxID=2991925 RepID=A0ABW6IGV7_9CYAN
MAIVGSLLHGSTTSLAQLSPVTEPIQNQAAYSYRDPANGYTFTGVSGGTALTSTALVDPLGQILGCDGNPLPNYAGFSIALYEPDASGIELGNLLTLTPTEFPDITGNGVAGGKAPNVDNVNPFSLTNADAGQYNFLFDPDANLISPVNAGLQQTSVGAQYILVVRSPSDSGLPERRVLLEILNSTGGVNNSIVRYRATALDGQPLSATGGIQVTDTVVEVLNAETQGLNLFSLALGVMLCKNNQLEITKTADRAAAQPGDTAVYRLTLRNLSEVPLDAVSASDQLPFGFRFLPESVRGEINGQIVPIEATASRDGHTVVFSTPVQLPTNGVLNLVYALQITPDARRGTGRNSAIANAARTDNDFVLQDGPVSHLMRLEAGILSDCGTLIGRVFVDKNFDGEQQPGEPGLPNAVVFLDDGNRIVTDANGLFSVANMLPGRRSGTLDLSSLPGYTLAPNLYVRERNSQSRLVNLAPGGMVRMNFAVTPAAQQEAQ